MSRTQISIIVPVYNEEQNLAALAGEIRCTMQGIHLTYEVVFVDDCSTDGSLAVLRRLAAEDPALRLLAHRRNAGQSAALAAGFRCARGEIIVTLDADLQNDPADIPRLLEELRGCDIVSGVRLDRHDSWLRRISTRIANRVRQWVTGDRITDIGCGLKAYRARYVHRVPMFVGAHRFLPALAQREGARVKEVPVRHRPRSHGTSKYKITNRLWHALLDLLAVKWMQARWIDRDNAAEVEVVSSETGGASDDSPDELCRPRTSSLAGS